MALMGATLAGAAGAQTMEEGAAPTRLMHCQREVAGAKGDRAQLLRACLNRRLEGERRPVGCELGRGRERNEEIDRCQEG